jgi:hypothetical protein
MNAKTNSKISLAVAVILSIAAAANWMWVNHSKNQLLSSPSDTIVQEQTETRPPLAQNTFVQQQTHSKTEAAAEPWPTPFVNEQTFPDETPQGIENIPDDM